MGKRNFETAAEAIAWLKKNAKSVTVSGKVIKVSKKSLTGIAAWGAIDYLQKHKYVVQNEAVSA